MELSIFLTTYSMVFIVELVGDKMIYTITTLTTQFRAIPVLCGISVAFMIKMLAAVMFGQIIAKLPVELVAGLSAVSFITIAFLIWSKKTLNGYHKHLNIKNGSRIVLIAFAAIFFSEWGDVGQITVATLSLNFQAPMTVWAGATLAMFTKGALAVLVGLELRKRIPERAMTNVTVLVCFTMGLLSIIRILG